MTTPIFEKKKSAPAVAILVGAIAEPDPRRPGLFLLNSINTHREFDEEFRDVLVEFAKFNPWERALALMNSIGGSESDLNGWVSSGLLKAIPAAFSYEQFLEVFGDVALISTTAISVRGLSDRYAYLSIPDDPDGTIRVSRFMYEILRNSPAMLPIPEVLAGVCMNDEEAIVLAIEEFVMMLQSLIDYSMAALIYA